MGGNSSMAVTPAPTAVMKTKLPWHGVSELGILHGWQSLHCRHAENWRENKPGLARTTAGRGSSTTQAELKRC